MNIETIKTTVQENKAAFAGAALVGVALTAFCGYKLCARQKDRARAKMISQLNKLIASMTANITDSAKREQLSKQAQAKANEIFKADEPTEAEIAAWNAYYTSFVFEVMDGNN